MAFTSKVLMFMCGGSVIFGSVLGQAAVVTKAVKYQQGGTQLEGFVSYDDSVKKPRPGILVFSDWMGVGANVKKRIEQLAELGYVAFAGDIYGEGVHPKDASEAGKLAGKYKGDRTLMRARAEAGLAELKKMKQVDSNRLADMGYCFGGTVALELGRYGAPLKGIVTFHGGLDTPTPQDAKNIHGKVLAFHGGDDPYVPMKDVEAFQKEMREAAVDWQMVIYGGAVHSFTIAEAGNDNSKGAAYNAAADHRSWEGMKTFWSETLK